jgi:hypothetical protein
LSGSASPKATTAITNKNNNSNDYDDYNDDEWILNFISIGKIFAF